MANLMAVAEFAKLCLDEGNIRWNSPQKINAAVRKLNAPVDVSTGKRMIDPDVWDDWAKNIPDVSRKAPTTGTKNRSKGVPKEVKNSLGIKPGSAIMYQSGVNESVTFGGIVTNDLDEVAVPIDVDRAPTVLFDWSTIDRMVSDGKMVVGHVGDMLYVMAEHMKASGDYEAYDTLKPLVDKYGKSSRGGV